MTTNSTSADTLARPTLATVLGDLRTVLRLDAVVTGANGLAYLVLADPLGDLFGVSEAFLRGVGVFLAGFALAVWAIASAREVDRGLAACVAVANVAWVPASITAVAGDLHGLTTAGAVWTCAQALVVAAIAALQARALRS